MFRGTSRRSMAWAPPAGFFVVGSSPALRSALPTRKALSGGGSAPSPNTATSWANMYDAFQNAALATPLAIPLIYIIL